MEPLPIVHSFIIFIITREGTESSKHWFHFGYFTKIQHEKMNKAKAHIVRRTKRGKEINGEINRLLTVRLVFFIERRWQRCWRLRVNIVQMAILWTQGCKLLTVILSFTFGRKRHCIGRLTRGQEGECTFGLIRLRKFAFKSDKQLRKRMKMKVKSTIHSGGFVERKHNNVHWRV